MHKTSNDLSQQVRTEVVALLQERLAEGIDLAQQTKQAHWNVKGPSFIALHELFDQIHGRNAEHVDLLAERIVQLGGIAEGTIRVAAKRSTLKEYPLTISKGTDHVEALAHALAACGEKIRAAIDRAAGLGDADTADILTEISRDLDKDLWFVEAHNQAER